MKTKHMAALNTLLVVNGIISAKHFYATHEWAWFWLSVVGAGGLFIFLYKNLFIDKD